MRARALGCAGQHVDTSHPLFSKLLEAVEFEASYRAFLVQFPEEPWSRRQLCRAIYRRGLMARAFTHAPVYTWAKCFFGCVPACLTIGASLHEHLHTHTHTHERPAPPRAPPRASPPRPASPHPAPHASAV
jgi:hypothetical protein